jgi:hypothetical protein
VNQTRIKATAITPSARAWIEANTYARVIYISKSACYLANGRDEILSLITEAVGIGPFAISLRNVNLATHIELDDEVQIAKDCLEVGDLIIHFCDALIWNPRPAWDLLQRELDIADLRLLREMLTEYAPANSLAPLLGTPPPPESALDIALLQQAYDPARKLTQGLLIDDLKLASQGVLGLAGFGSGLTPDGDDWILGSLLAVWVCKPESDAKQINDTLCKLAAEKTTMISAAWLSAASRGECSLQWHELFEAFLSQDMSKVQSSAKSIIHHGHTSGASALAGFIASCEGRNLNWILTSSDQ